MICSSTLTEDKKNAKSIDRRFTEDSKSATRRILRHARLTAFPEQHFLSASAEQRSPLPQ
jgi:hypothetical protein